MTIIPNCPSILPGELKEPLRQFGRSWAASPLRPYPTSKVMLHWDRLILEWAAEATIPLFIRKKEKGHEYGEMLTHSSGRILIPVDNSPAQWAFGQALIWNCPSLEEISIGLKNDQIPVGMVIKKQEGELPQLKWSLKKHSLNELGWKLGHIDGVGLNDRKLITDQPIDTLKRHFQRLMSPTNMFLVPVVLEGLAEVPAVIEEIQKYNNQFMVEDELN